MARAQEQVVRFVLKPLVLLGCLAPLLQLVAGATGLGGMSLGANPVEAVLHGLGKWGLNFLVITLCITPLRQISGWVHWMRFRRMLGLTAFFYLAGHFAFYLVVDRGLDLRTLTEDVIERPYIAVGLAGLLLLAPLAITSTRAAMRRLGRRWQTLHRLAYVAAACGVVHYLWLVKADLRAPLAHAATLALLLAARLAPPHRRLSSPAPPGPRPRRSAAPPARAAASAAGEEGGRPDRPRSGR